MSDVDAVRADAEAALIEAQREIARCSVLLAVSTVALRLGVHVETIREWIRKGHIPSIQLPNGYYRVTGETLDLILAGKLTPSNRKKVTDTKRSA